MDRAPSAFPDTDRWLAYKRDRQQFFYVLLVVTRLHRLATLKSAPGLTAGEKRLIDRALYSTYWDCVALGLRAEARKILGLPPDG